MNIKLLDSWIREYLDTKATPAQIAKYLSLCGPSVERLEKKNGDWIYDIEVTTNRVDSMCVYGIAREVSAILPQFGIQAVLKKLDQTPPKKPKNSLPLKVISDKKLVYRTTGVVVDEIKNWESPEWIRKRLEGSGLRSLNSVVDITNYVMLELGHPMHVFDYDKIPSHTLIVRESKKGEEIVSLDNKKYTLAGGDIIFQSVDGEIIDLPGIIGTKNSVVSKDTKRVLFFIDNNDPVRIRKSSMSLAIRTFAATLNEKAVDPEMGMKAILRASQLAQKICKARIASQIHDNYTVVPSIKEIKTTHQYIENKLGVEIKKTQISQILRSLEFEPVWSQEELKIKVPSFRSNDIEIAEDVVEEVARIYGYHNLPSNLMEGPIPQNHYDSPFAFEMELKRLMKALGGFEVYTLSLVPKEEVPENKALRLKNPLGEDTQYLRTSLLPSLIKAANSNKSQHEKFLLFEMASVYLPKQGKLPEEQITLSGIFYGYDFREAKGILETIIEKLHIKPEFIPEDFKGFVTSKRIVIKIGKNEVGDFGIIEDGNYIVLQLNTEILRRFYKKYQSYIPSAKYPPQIEDITLVLPERTKIGNILQAAKSSDKNIARVNLKDIYKDFCTIRVWYQNSKNTLYNKEVEEIRNLLLASLKSRFGIEQKN